MITISEIKGAIAAAYTDAEKLLPLVEEAVPALEADIPAMGAETAEISAALAAAKATQDAIGNLLLAGQIEPAYHNELQARVAVVMDAVPSVTTPAPEVPQTTGDGQV